MDTETEVFAYQIDPFGIQAGQFDEETEHEVDEVKLSAEDEFLWDLIEFEKS